MTVDAPERYRREMRRAVVAGLVLVGVLAACTKPNPSYCDDSGDRPCGDGFICVDHACVERIDAPTVDARPPIVRTHQGADLVVGQESFDDRIDGGCHGDFVEPTGVAEADGRLFIADDNRVLVWSTIPTANGEGASFALGQPTLDSCVVDGTFSDREMYVRGGIVSAAGKLLVPDAPNNRVLIWDEVFEMQQRANLVVGQPDFQSTDGTIPPNPASRDEVSYPIDAWSDGDVLVVADRDNNRVLIWNAFPTVNGVLPDVVLGQTDFTGSRPPEVTTASTLAYPQGVWMHDGRLYVASSGEGRVLIWNSIPTVNGQPADLVVGAESLAMVPAGGLSATTLTHPTSVVANDDALFVADANNDRVLVFSPLPVADGAAAAFVLGQPDFTTGANDRPPSRQALNKPLHVSLGETGLWVVDEDNRRVLRFELYPVE